MYKLLISILFISKISFANIISIPLKDDKFSLAPASDLTYKGEHLSENEALNLARKGIDLSLLSPKESTLFDESSPANQLLPKENINEVNFHSLLGGPTEFFRSAVKTNNKSYTLTASLYNHETMLRANLLNLSDYKIPEIKFQKTLKIRFSSLEELEAFKGKLVDSTLLSQKRWIKEENKEKNFLILKGVLLEPAELKSVPVYWPIMEESRQRKRRIFRSLLYIYALTNFSEHINQTKWSVGSVFNQELILAHPYSSEFSGVTIDDLKWIHRKVSRINETLLKRTLLDAGYPKDIAFLLFEKLKSRINSIGKLLKEPITYSYNTKLTIGNVKRGKLVGGDYVEYVPNFWSEDPLSPFRFSEVFKFFRTQVSYDTASTILDKAVSSFLPKISTSDAVEKIFEKITNFKDEKGFIPLKVWSYPTVEGGASGSRNIVFGRYQNNDAPIQLVDSVRLNFKVGVFGYTSGYGSGVSPTGAVSAQVVRNWTHVRAMPDLTTATEQEVKKLLIPNLLKNLGSMLNPQIECSLEQDVWWTEEIVVNMRTWVIYYNKDLPNGIELAKETKLQLIADGVPANKILFKAESKSLLCEKEIAQKRDASLDKFLKSFALDETITITDSLEVGARVGVRAEVGILNSLKVEANLAKQKGILRSFVIRKTEDGLEITINNQRVLTKNFSQGIDFFVELVSNSTRWSKGELNSKVYRMNFTNLDQEGKKTAMQILREIFLRSSYDQLFEYYNPIKLDHQAKFKLKTFKFFWKKSENFNMNHEVEIIVPNKLSEIEIPQEEVEDEWTIPQPSREDLPESARTRSLYNSVSLYRSGSNYHSFLDDIINEQFSWLSTGAADNNPGQSIYGKSNHRYVMTEGELTETFDISPVVKIEYGNIGWQASSKKVESLLKRHEGYLNSDEDRISIDRELFNETDSLRSYSIRSTIIIYPSGVQNLYNKLFAKKELDTIKFLKRLYGVKKWDKFCKRRNRYSPSGSDSHLYRSERNRELYYCVPRSAQKLLRVRKRGRKTERKGQIQQMNYVVGRLFSFGNQNDVLKFIGKANYFGNTFISGFRNNDSTGYLTYTSNTVGTYDKELGTGLFDQISNSLGIQSYTVKGMVFSPNM